MDIQPKIILLLETSRQLGREMLRGAADWSQRYGPITLSATAGHFEQSLPNLRKEKNFGVIARLSVPELIQSFKKYHFPLIVLEPVTQDLLHIKEEFGFPEIRSDSETIAIMGADYLLEDGFQNFAFCGFPNRLWSQRRSNAFIKYVEQEGGCCFVYPENEKELSWEQERPILKKWLQSLPKPIGLLACDDDRAHQILQLCEEKNIRVPQDISVLGIGNDEILCELAMPPLSSIAIDLFNAGFEATRVLVDLINGKTESPDYIMMKPRWVTSRRSTEFLAVNDTLVINALQFIRQNYFRQINVHDVVKYLDCSHRTLEMRFHAARNRTVADEIEHYRMERAKRLLHTSNDSVSSIAELSGFYNFRSMLRAFHLIEHCTPTEYREKFCRSG
ncbi:MAG: substrate-binding domain-containing protein [Planctomycetaceae bacterium]|jgi:LacI family transcriptional regulator|nr:substrate-binding domain-containing protein [Planctomycetaceae bacterium]